MSERARLVSRLGHGISLIRLPLPFDRLNSVNTYLIEGRGRLTLIDCGVDTAEGLHALIAGLEQLGHGLSDLTTLVGTHLHPDHVALAAQVVERSGCEYVLHEAAPGLFDDYDDWARNRIRMGTLAAAHGALRTDVEAIEEHEPRPPWAAEALAPTRTVADGDIIAVGEDRHLEVMHTPGHDAAHICLIDSLTGALFSGDHVLPRITPVVQYDEDTDQLGTYLASLSAVERLDVGLTYPAHGQIMERGSLRARQIILHHERRLGAILQELRHGPTTAWTVMNSLFRPNLLVFERRLALSETLAHLEHLVAEEDATRFEEDGVWYYRLPTRRW